MISSEQLDWINRQNLSSPAHYRCVRRAEGRALVEGEEEVAHQAWRPVGRMALVLAHLGQQEVLALVGVSLASFRTGSLWRLSSASPGDGCYGSPTMWSPSQYFCGL